MIPDYAKSILDFYLTNNLNLGYKSFDTSTLNLLRLDSTFLNIDNLDHCISDLVQRVTAEVIQAEDISSYITKERNGDPFAEDHNITENDHALYGKNIKEAREDFERNYFNYHIQQGKSVTDVAKISGVERTHLYRKLKQLGIKNK
jgi:DNA-binding NtrC family response regulator